MIKVQHTNSISTGAQYVTLDSKIKCLSLAGFFFSGNPTNETVTGTAHTWWGLLITGISLTSNGNCVLATYMASRQGKIFP